MMYKLKNCALCGEEKELELSHIIPKMAVRKLKKTSIGNIRNLEEVNLGKNISESRVSTMERLKEAQKRSEEIRSVQGKTTKAMGWERQTINEEKR